MSTSKKLKRNPDGESAPFWLLAYSQDEAWREGASDAVVAWVLAHLSDEEVSATLRELKTNNIDADGARMANLLRHWARLAFEEREVPDNPRDLTSIRSAARKLHRVLANLDELLRDDAARLAYPISQHLDQDLPVHHSYELLRSAKSITAELLPAAEKLSMTKLSRGPRADLETRMLIDGLIEIFEFASSGTATRVYNPISGKETSAFLAFAERAMRLIEDGSPRPVEWAIRSVLADRVAGQPIPGPHN